MESRDPIFLTCTRGRSRVFGNDRLFPLGSEFGPNPEIPASPIIQLRPRPVYWQEEEVNICHVFCASTREENVEIYDVLTSLTGLFLAEWRSGSVSALPCERRGFGPRTRLREIIPANNCTMQGQNNWGNWGSPGVMKL